MEMNPKNGAGTPKGTSRRDFAKKVAWTAPALTLMMAASSQPARANFSYGHTYEGGYEEKKKKTDGYFYKKVWKSVHRGRKH
jgi:hypothetical protein